MENTLFEIEQNIQQRKEAKAKACIEYVHDLMEGENNENVKKCFRKLEIILRNNRLMTYKHKLMDACELFENESSQNDEIVDDKLDVFFAKTSCELGIN